MNQPDTMRMREANGKLICLVVLSHVGFPRFLFLYILNT